MTDVDGNVFFTRCVEL